MSRESLHSIERQCIRLSLNNSFEVLKSGGIKSGTVSFENGDIIFTTDGKITYSKVFPAIKSVRIVGIDLDTTTEDIVTLTSSHSITVSGGTISATGFSAPTIYVKGVATSTIGTDRSEILVTTATAFDINDLIIGYVSGYLEGRISMIEFYNYELSAVEPLNLYENKRFRELHPVNELINVTAQNGTIHDRRGNALTLTDMAVHKDGQARVMFFNSTSSLVETTLANDIKSVLFWMKPNSNGESIIDLGSGNTIATIAGVLTAVWADNIYVNGKAGTATKTDIWNLIICTVASAISITDIDIGKISTTFYDGLMNYFRINENALSAEQCSQIYTSEKWIYGL